MSSSGAGHATLAGMSKHNVNPDHYKVAGRERQGEGILQARNKQKLAQSVVRERFEMRQAAPAGTSPTDPSTFPSAPSVANARQESGSSDETPPEPGNDAASSRRAAAPAPTATGRSRKGAPAAKKPSASSGTTRGTNTKTRSGMLAKKLSRATARTSAASAGKKGSTGGAKKPSGTRSKSSGGVKKRAGAPATRKRTTGNR